MSRTITKVLIGECVVTGHRQWQQGGNDIRKGHAVLRVLDSRVVKSHLSLESSPTEE
jgi:hypothetical protein